jgi:hypothetical protein
MTPKQRVLKRHPEAWSGWSSIYGEWRIYNKVGGRMIGVSMSHRAVEAWADAAKHIRPTSTRNSRP